MLFVTLGTPRAGTLKERTERRLKWSFPEGANVLGEYWLMTPDPALIVISEADNIAPIMAGTAAWDDVFSFSTYPAVTAEEGKELVAKIMA
jgi:Domain of unknown function (DUF3303)